MYPIPANAMRIRYLESTGTQYIDTGIVPTQTTKIEFAYLLTQTPTDSYAAAFGCLGATGGATSGQNTYSGFVLFNNPSVPVQARVGKSNAANIVSDISVAANVLYDGDVQFGRMRLNGTEYTQSGSGSWITMIRSICTHAANDQSDTFRRRFVHARFFYFLIYDGSTLVRDFAPVRVGQTGCLFDRVTGQFFYNQGTGSFVCGEDDFSIFSHAVKHLSDTGTFLASRVMGDSSGTVKAVRKHYDMPVQYTIDECNGNAPTAVNVYFPSGTYENLDYTPTWSGHRFVGWYTTSATPSTTAPTSGTQVQKGDSVVFDRSTVYARWQLPTTVTFDATTNGGQMPSGWVSPDYYEGQPYGTLPEPTKSGEVFLGWFTSGGTRVTTSSAVTSGTLTARYMAVTWATTYSCTTTSSYKNTGIYAANRYSSSDPIAVDWGDGTMDVVYGNISQLAHTYPSATTYTVKISDNISTFCPSYGNSTWYQTTSQNQYTFKKVLTLSSKVTQLSQYAFYYCSAMTDAIIPSGATSIPNYCFYCCQQLKSSTVQLPSTVTSIGSCAFYLCTSSNFSSITIPSACTSIGTQAFQQCYYLHPTFESGSATLTLNTYSFAYCFYQSSASGTIDLSQRKITSIPNYCFYYCTYLKGITWPQGLTSIGGSAFRYCFYYAASTGTIEIPEGVTTISSTYAFANCLYLTAVTLPSTLTNLNNYTFYYCTRLATITSNRSTAPTVSAQTFGNSATYYTGRTSYSAGTNKLYVPAGATGYNASYWLSPLCNSTMCGFTLEYMAQKRVYDITYQGDTIRVEFNFTNKTASILSAGSGALSDAFVMVQFDSEWDVFSEGASQGEPGGNLLMVWTDMEESSDFNNYSVVYASSDITYSEVTS